MSYFNGERISDDPDPKQDPSPTDHLQLFIYRVKRMRELQSEYFNSRRKSVMLESMTAEKQVDDAIKLLTGTMGYSTVQYDGLQPKKLF
jgi:hypothetical protein